MGHQLVDVLRRIYGLEEASEEALMTLGAASSFLVWEQGSIVFEHGDRADGVFVVVGGSVEVLEPDGDLVATVGQGHIVGEISTMFGTPHTKTVRAAERAELLFVPKGSFDAYLSEHPDQAERLRAVIEERLSAD